jgi:hypothetical protein
MEFASVWLSQTRLMPGPGVLLYLGVRTQEGGVWSESKVKRERASCLKLLDENNAEQGRARQGKARQGREWMLGLG